MCRSLPSLKFSNSILACRHTNSVVWVNRIRCYRHSSLRAHTPAASMGAAWSDVLYPDNPHRREQVAELSNQLRSNVEAVHTTCLSMSLVLNAMSPEFPVIPPIDLTKTYYENIDVLKATFAQWASIIEQEKNGEEVTEETRQFIDDINSATDAKAFSDHVDKVIAEISDGAFWSRQTIKVVAATLATRAAYNLVISALAEGALAIVLGVVGGAIAGAAAAAVVDLIIGAIDGARERSEVEARAAELREAIDKFTPEVTNLQKEVAGTMLKIVLMQSKIQEPVVENH